MKPKFGTWIKISDQYPPYPENGSERYLCTLPGGVVRELELVRHSVDRAIWTINGAPAPWPVIAYMPLPRPSTEHRAKVIISNVWDDRIRKWMTIPGATEAAGFTNNEPIIIFSHTFEFSDGEQMSLTISLAAYDRALEIAVKLGDKAESWACYTSPVSILGDYKLCYNGETYIGTIESCEVEGHG